MNAFDARDKAIANAKVNIDKILKKIKTAVEKELLSIQVNETEITPAVKAWLNDSGYKIKKLSSVSSVICLYEISW